jgi:hypothetical protein
MLAASLQLSRNLIKKMFMRLDRLKCAGCVCFGRTKHNALHAILKNINGGRFSLALGTKAWTTGHATWRQG